MNQAPYVIRDDQGFWHTYDLPTAWDDRPVGVLLVVYLQPLETLSCQTIIDALKPALHPAPQGDWYSITVADRNVRSSAPLGNVLITLHYPDQVQVVEKVLLGTWGRIVAYSHNRVITALNGFVLMSSLVKV